MIGRLRYRLARRLVGPFVALPQEDGAFLVTREGLMTTVIVANTLTVTSSIELAAKVYGNTSDWTFRPHRRNGRFEGTFS